MTATAWARIRRVGTGAALLLILASPQLVRAQDPLTPAKPAKQTVAQLRSVAESAEKAGDWEAAFTAYCHLFVADRTAPDIREKLNTALRRSQQFRRHRDPRFQQFAANLPSADAMKLFAEVLTKVPVVYADRERATPQILWENGVEELNRALGDPVFRAAFLDGANTDKVEGFRQALKTSWARQTITDAAGARSQLRKLTDAAQAQFPVRVPAALVIEVVCGACGGLDEYTVFLNPAQFNPKSQSSVPDLTAQGVYLGFSEGELIVTGIAVGSWADVHTKQLRKGDRIARLNGRPMDMPTPAIAAEALRNPIDGFHEIEIDPTDEVPAKAASLPVVVPSVYDMKLLANGVGYVRVNSITMTTPRELDEAIHWMKSRSVRAVVLDLRGNMGGSFVAAVDTAKRLIPAGLIVTTQGQVSQVDNQPFSSDSGMSAHDIPLVVLVDQETASAAEVIAAALKDRDRATLVGMATFGKGAIQYPMRLDSLDEKDEHGRPKTHKSGGVRLTIAKLISPRGNAINGVGIVPHFLEADPDEQLKLATRKATELMQPLTRPSPLMPTLPSMAP